jgi:hypothetical protein
MGAVVKWITSIVFIACVGCTTYLLSPADTAQLQRAARTSAGAYNDLDAGMTQAKIRADHCAVVDVLNHSNAAPAGDTIVCAPPGAKTP